MQIGGMQKFTTLDYPGKIAATVFTMGCNFRCPFCHNAELVEPGGKNKPEIIKDSEVFDFLNSRRDELDGVCISGGEPTLQNDLITFLKKVKSMGYSIKLDTNGCNTGVIKAILEENLIDYFAIDIKTSFEKYHLVNAPENAQYKVLETIDSIIRKSVALELRTTVVPRIVKVDDFDDIIREINSKNILILKNLVRYSVQGFRAQKCLDKKFENVKPYDDIILEEIAEKLRKYVKRVDILK